MFIKLIIRFIMIKLVPLFMVFRIQSLEASKLIMLIYHRIQPFGASKFINLLVIQQFQKFYHLCQSQIKVSQLVLFLHP